MVVPFKACPPLVPSRHGKTLSRRPQTIQPDFLRTPARTGRSFSAPTSASPCSTPDDDDVSVASRVPGAGGVFPVSWRRPVSRRRTGAELRTAAPIAPLSSRSVSSACALAGLAASPRRSRRPRRLIGGRGRAALIVPLASRADPSSCASPVLRRDDKISPLGRHKARDETILQLEPAAQQVQFVVPQHARGVAVLDLAGLALAHCGLLGSQWLPGHRALVVHLAFGLSSFAAWCDTRHIARATGAEP